MGESMLPKLIFTFNCSMPAASSPITLKPTKEFEGEANSKSS